MTAQITVTITAELPSFRPDPKIPTFGVHLAFAGSEQEVTTLLTKFTQLKKSVTGTPNFTAYKRNGNKAQPLNLFVLTRTAPNRIGGEAVHRWLVDEQHASFNILPTDQEVDPGASPNPIAAHTLQGSIGWNAPIPHELGLSYVVSLKEAPPGGDAAALGVEFLLPFSLDDIAETEISLAPPDRTPIVTTKEVTLKDLNNLKVTVRTVKEILPLDAHPIVPMGDDGFLKQIWSEDEFRVLDAVQSRGQSLFWALPTLITLGSDWQSRVDQKATADFTIIDVQKYARNGSLLLLDPLLISLMAPGLPKTTECEGHVLSPLMREVEKAAGNSMTASERQEALRRLQEVIKNKLIPEIQKPQSPTLLHILFDNVPPIDDTLALWDSIASTTGYSHDLPQILRALNTQMSSLQSEAGMEPVLVRLLTKAKSLDANWSKPPLEDGFNKYKQLVNSDFNAVDAVRFDCGHIFANGLVSKFKPAEADKLWTMTSDLDLFNKRFFKSAVRPEWIEPLPELDETWVTIDPKKPKALQNKLTDEWQKSVSSALPPKPKGIALTLKDTRRFVPDRDPQPLPIAISQEIDASKVHEFNERFNGIAVLIRRKGEPWAHANLAALSPWKTKLVPADESPYEPEVYVDSNSTKVMRLGLRPLLPASIDGKREMFIRYYGFPLSSPAYSQTTPAGAFPDQAQSRSIRQFYQAQDVDFSQSLTKLAKLPRLNYGVQYESAAFAISKAGVLPKVLQKSESEPWLPTDAPLITVTPQSKALYQRRTAIGATTFATLPGTPERIGIQFPDVYPLSLDSPRIAVVANTVDQSGWIDLFRNTDGTGQLKLQTRSQGVIGFIISEIRSYARETDATITIEVQEAPNATPATIPVISVPLTIPPGVGNWEFALVPSDEKDVDNWITIKVPVATAAVKDQTYWVRLKIFPKKGVRSLSFAPPQQLLLGLTPSSTGTTNTAQRLGQSIDSHGTLPNSPPVLLVGAQSDNAFYQKFTDTAKVSCVLPRTTWLDWEHWYGNGTLPLYGQNKLSGAAQIDKVLTSASVFRSLDTEFSRLLDRLPDPSVSGFLVELTAIDTITINSAPLSLKPKSIEIAYDKLLESFTDLRNALPPTDPTKLSDWVKQVREKLRAIDQKFRLNFEVDCKDWNLKLDLDGTLKVTVPSGVCARLTVRPLVKTSCFLSPADDAAFYPQMQQLAIGAGAFAKCGDCQIFEGASLTIEGMYKETYQEDTYISLINKHIEIKTSATLRGYQILTKKDEFNDKWRCFANIDIRTQRWRFSGRPIYSWISPRESAFSGQDLNHAALSLEEEAVQTFESEAYFDRDDADCELVQVRLTGDRQELKLVTWDPPSATYFRHSFGFVSRYSGGMWKPGPGDPIWPPSLPLWKRRVVVLADPNRLEVTRPQVRCIIPLSTSPESATAAKPTVLEMDTQVLAQSPPVTCILEERPFLVGGLADRIAAEIATDIGYGFDPPEAAGGAPDLSKIGTVQPLDIGKETSRDGRLTAWSWLPHTRDENSRNPTLAFVLDAEGPVGLHFEGPTVPAPAWSNCQYVLRPRSLVRDRTLPEESFIGVRLRRFLDPDWLIQLPTHSGNAVAPLPSHQAFMHQSCVARFDLSALAIRPDDSPLIKLIGADPHVVVRMKNVVTAKSASEQSQKSIVLTMGRECVLGDEQRPGLPLCMVPLDDCSTIKELWLMHTPHNESNFTLSVAALPESGNPANGQIKSPLLLATVTWSTKAMSKPAELKYIEFPNCSVVEPLTSSLPTFREWARTAKNAGVVTQLDSVKGESGLLDITDLTASLKSSPAGATLSFGTGVNRQQSTWIIGSSSNSRMPLYVQRHIVGVFTYRSATLHRQIDVFSEARILAGKSPTLKLEKTSRIDGVELHELELPAVIVAGKKGKWPPFADQALSKFNEAHIDLISTGGDVRNTVYRMFVRFANSKESLAKANFKLSIAQRAKLPDRLALDGTSDSSEIISTAVADCPAGIRSCDLVWSTNSEYLVVRVQLWDGTTAERTSVRWDKKPGQIPAAVSISIRDVANCDDEIWADVSLLHRQFSADAPIETESKLKMETDRFNFECLFSKSDGLPEATARSTQPSLESRTEAQARLISRSASIPISL